MLKNTSPVLPPTLTPVEILHDEFVRIKDGMNINDAKSPEAFLEIFSAAFESAKIRMAFIISAHH